MLKLLIKKNILLYLIGLSVLISGCSLLRPKNIELFQDKIKPVPEPTTEHKEVIKQAAEFVARKAEESHIQAVKEEASTNLISLTYETSTVADSLSDSIGPPFKKWNYEAELLSLKLDKLEAKLDRKLDEFKESNNENIGAKIEGTGLINISYFSFIIGLIVLIAIIYFATKVISILNPPIGVGMQVAQLPVKLAAKAMGQVISAGERFKDRIDKEFNDENTKNKIREIFRDVQERGQDLDVQQIIRHLTKK